MNILVIRFSAFGDVAMLAPVLTSLLANNSALEITLVTNKNFSSLFNNIDRLKVIEGDLYGKHKGFIGLSKLAIEILKLKKFRFGIDLHQSLRSKVIKSLLKLKGVEFINYDKGRPAKKLLTQKENKQLKELPHTVERYMECFEDMRLNTKIKAGPWFFPSEADKSDIEKLLAALPKKQFNIVCTME